MKQSKLWDIILNPAPPLCRRRRGRMHQRVPENPPGMCKKRVSSVMAETGSVWMWGGKGHEKKTPPIA